MRAFQLPQVRARPESRWHAGCSPAFTDTVLASLQPFEETSHSQKWMAWTRKDRGGDWENFGRGGHSGGAHSQ